MGAGESSEAGAQAPGLLPGDLDTSRVDINRHAARIEAAWQKIPVQEARPVHRIVDSHECYVRVLVWDPYRDVMVSGGGDGWIRLWSTKNYSHVGEMDAKLSVRSLLVLTEELASGHSNGEVLLWGMEDESHSLVQRLQAHKEAVYALAYLSSGELVTGAEDIRVFSRGMLGMFVGYQHALTIAEEVLCMCTVPGSTQVVTGNMNSLILVWDSADNWAVTAECNGHKRSVWAVCFVREARRCCSGSADHSIRVWNPYSWECEHVLKDHTGWVVGLGVGVGSLLSCSIDQGIRLWNAKTWTCERTFTEQEYEVYCVCAIAGGRFATGGAEMAILIYGGPEHATGQAGPGSRPFAGVIPESPGGASRRQGGKGAQQPRDADISFGSIHEDLSYPSLLENARDGSGMPRSPRSNNRVGFAPGTHEPAPLPSQRRAQLMAASELDITMSDFRRQLVDVERSKREDSRSRADSRSRLPQRAPGAPPPASSRSPSPRTQERGVLDKMYDGITAFAEKIKSPRSEAKYPEQGMATAMFGTGSPTHASQRRQPSPKPVSKSLAPDYDDIMDFETMKAVPNARDLGLLPDAGSSNTAQGSDGVTDWSSVLRASKRESPDLRRNV